MKTIQHNLCCIARPDPYIVLYVLQKATMLLLFGSRARAESGEDSGLELTVGVELPAIDKVL